MKIVTHPGQAHRDDFVACCIILAHEGGLPIERRDPKDSDLADARTFVIDVGEVYDPSCRNFDHHQFAQDGRCATSLIMEYYGYPRDILLLASPWIEFTDYIDNKGPFEAAKYYDFDQDLLPLLLSPIEAQVLRLFQNEKSLSLAEDPEGTHKLMRTLGRAWTEYWDRFKLRLSILSSTVDYTAMPDYSYAAVSLGVAGDDDPTLALEQFLMHGHKPMPVSATITKDDRGPGLCLFRRNDWPGLDLSKLKDHPEVIFAHAGGFVAKLSENVDKNHAINMLRSCYDAANAPRCDGLFKATKMPLERKIPPVSEKGGA